MIFWPDVEPVNYEIADRFATPEDRRISAKLRADADFRRNHPDIINMIERRVEEFKAEIRTMASEAISSISRKHKGRWRKP